MSVAESDEFDWIGSLWGMQQVVCADATHIIIVLSTLRTGH